MTQKISKKQMDNKKIDWKEVFCVSGMMLMVFLISINHINESNGIKIYGDELGYWRNAALLTGRDWSGEASLNAYYGYGYGFLLAPILLLFHKNPADMMHAVIILQGVMLSSCIMAAWLILKKIDRNLDWKYRMLMSLFCVLYPANIFLVKFSLSEIILTTCVWWISYLTLCYSKSKKVMQGTGIIVLSVYMFSVNQRMITMVLTGFLLVLSVPILGQKKSKREIIKLIVTLSFVLLILLCIHKLYDSYYIDRVYSLAADGGKETNRVDTSARNMFSILISLEGIWSIIISLMGKLFYSFVGTYGFVLIGVYACIYFFIKYVKEKDNLDSAIWYLYIFLNYMAVIGVASLSMRGGWEMRSDFFMYGRYSEFTYGPILLSGLIYLYTFERKGNMRNFISMGMILLLGLVCVYHTYNQAPNSNFWASCIALSDLRTIPEITNKEVVLVAVLRCVGIIGILVLLESCFNHHKKYVLSMALIVVIVLWIHTAEINWNKNVLSWYTKQENAMCDIVDGMEYEDIFITFDAKLAGCLQFLLPDTSLHPCANMEEIMEYGQETYVITNLSSEYTPYIREHFVIDKENDMYVRWKREE